MSQDRWIRMLSLACLLILPLQVFAQTDDSPAPPRGTEYRLTLEPPPGDLDHARFELWLPASAAGGRITAAICMPLYQADRLIYELPQWRRFAHDRRAVLLRHDMRATVDGRAGRLPIGTDATDAIARALKQLAGTTDRPELARVPLVITGLSQGGAQTTRLASLIPDRTLAGIAYHGAAIPESESRLPVHDVPMLFPLGQTDGLTARVYPDLVASLRHQPLWAALLQPNVPHHLLGDQQFILQWLGAVFDARLPQARDGSTADPADLQPMRFEDGSLGDMRINARFQAGTVSTHRVADLPDASRRGHWIPADLARAWEIATRTGLVTGHRQAEEIAAFAEPAPAAITIDGNPAEWGTLPITMHWPAQVLPHGLNWRGPQDARADIAIAFDEAFLYLVIRVRDDDLMLNGKAPWSPGQDGVEIRLDARPAPTRMSNIGDGEGSDFGLIAVGPAGGSGEPAIIRAGLPDATGVATRLLPDGYGIELAIPAEYLHQRQARGKTWDRFRLNVTLNDDDRRDRSEINDRMGDTATVERSQLWWRPDWRSDMNWFGSGTIERR